MPHGPALQPAAQPAAPAYPSHPATMAAHFLRDGFGQIPSKLTGLAMFAWAAEADGAQEAVQVAAAAAGAISGFTVACKIAMHQIGTGDALCTAATALSAAAGGVAGMAFAVGELPTAVSVGATTLCAAFLLCAMRLASRQEGQSLSPCQKAAVALTSVAAGSAGYALSGYVIPGAFDVDHIGFNADPHFMARQLGAVFEALLVECFKDALKPCGPSVDRKGLTLEGRLLAASKGLAAYAGASVLINGLAGTALLPESDGTGGEVSFLDLMPAVILSCLVNSIRGGANAWATLGTWAGHHREGVPVNPHDLQARPKPCVDRAVALLDRSAARLVLIMWRNAIYVFLRSSGESVQSATLIAQGAYSFFAQYRDVISDLMAGDGWVPPEPAPVPDAGDPYQAEIARHFGDIGIHVAEPPNPDGEDASSHESKAAVEMHFAAPEAITNRPLPVHF